MVLIRGLEWLTETRPDGQLHLFVLRDGPWRDAEGHPDAVPGDLLPLRGHRLLPGGSQEMDSWELRVLGCDGHWREYSQQNLLMSMQYPQNCCSMSHMCCY